MEAPLVESLILLGRLMFFRPAGMLKPSVQLRLLAKCSCQPHAQSPTWRTRVSLFASVNHLWSVRRRRPYH